MNVSFSRCGSRPARRAAAGTLALLLFATGISSIGCAKKLPERTVPVAVYTSIADAYKRMGGIVRPWEPEHPDTLKVQLPPGSPPEDLDRTKAQLVVDLTRQKMGGQARVYLFTPTGALLAQSIPKNSGGG